jgi:CheY-like chemotaxis protein
MSEVLIVDDDHNFRETLRELLTDEATKPLSRRILRTLSPYSRPQRPTLHCAIGKCPVEGASSFSRVSNRKDC